ncbi:MAG: hypothetical protein AB1700_18285 [Bacillota bacterium]
MDVSAVLGLIVGFLSLVVVVIGWVVTAANQRTILLQSLKNQARVEISRALREYMVALGDIAVAVMNAASRLKMEKQLQVDWSKESDDLRVKLSSVPLEWVFLLEEHEALFPHTRKCRQELVRRNSRILLPIYGLTSDLLNPAKRKETIETSQGYLGDLTDQQALVMDLQVELQNDCFQPLAGTRAVRRRPKDPNLPRLVRDSDGQLSISPEEPTEPQER